MIHSFNIPAQLKHLKIDARGYPIPFFVPIKEGKPDFKFMDEKKQSIAIDKFLCHICGKKLNSDYHYFISGPVGLLNQVSSDAAMHRECAEFALEVCPHMLHRKAERKTDDGLGDLSPHAKVKPEFLLLIKSSKYRAKFHPDYGYRLIHYKSVSAEKYIYINDKLTKA